MWNWIREIEQLRLQGVPFVVATVTQITGSTPRNTGAKLIVQWTGTFIGTIGGGHLEQLVLEDAKKSMEEGVSQVIRYPLGAKTGQCCGGVIEILFEPIHCGPRLYLFGAGHVAQAICKSLVDTPFTVHLIDERPEWTQAATVPSDVIQHLTDWEDFFDHALWNEKKTYVLIMTHRHDRDQEIVHAALKKPAKYIGLIGSHSKWERFKQRLQPRGITSDQLSRVKSPIGIAIGGKSPQEVAISVAAELIQLHYLSQSTGGHETSPSST